MKTKYLFVSLLILGSPAQAAEVTVPDCAALGYTLNLSECNNLGGTPLLCPFYSISNPKVSCTVKSCRGYSLTESDVRAAASDGQPMYKHVKGETFTPKVETTPGILGCMSGFEKDASGNIKEIWRYKVSRCKDTSLYQNGVCDVGCDKVNKYPYNKHPGNLAGDVISCQDQDRIYYGYTGCNDGWTYNGKGMCILSSCNIATYPYTGNPNVLNKEERGTISTCKIGGNNYYKYTSCNPGFIQRGSVCIKRCDLNLASCQRNPVNTTLNGYAISYNDWKCDLATTKCSVGDLLYINNKEIGMLAYISAEQKKVIPTQNSSSYTMGYKIQWSDTASLFADIDVLTYGDMSTWGKIQTAGLKKYLEKYTQYNFPAVVVAYNYVPPTCTHDVCALNEWYMFNLDEYQDLAPNKYIINNALNGLYDFSGSSYHAAMRMSSNYGYYYDMASGLNIYMTTGQQAIVLPVMAF